MSRNVGYCKCLLESVKESNNNKRYSISNDTIISLARAPEIGQGLGRILSCGARKPEQS